MRCLIYAPEPFQNVILEAAPFRPLQYAFSLNFGGTLRQIWPGL